MFCRFLPPYQIIGFIIKPPLFPRVTKGFFEKLLFGAGTLSCQTWAWPRAAGIAGLPYAFPSFTLGQHRKSKGAGEATSEPYVFASRPCKRAQVTLFSSFTCMLAANPAMDLKTNHSYWFHFEFAMWNNSQKKRLPYSYKQKKNPTKTPKTPPKKQQQKRNPELSFALDNHPGMLKSPLSTSHWKLKETLSFVTKIEKCYYLKIGCGHFWCYNISHFKS